ncbi:GNAT family N-acetyltransferase [Flagellimonas onchidii]|uniref:GNAT family N-acetyltransferase n=1 Tax=Flagellimonas onchidii TaxID=2562684 RepID=UPI0010A664FD|nr:GNAT family N-acetyltransferase [Allomuricauda onchidii]
MASSNTECLTFLTDLYLKQDVIAQPYSYVGLSDDSNNNLIGRTSKLSSKNGIYSFTYVPDYVKTVISDSKKWTERIFSSVNGYSILINDFSCVEDYLRAHLKSRRKTINRAIRRLETCFDISYKMYQKEITNEEYLFLMSRLKAMIIKRFEQRGQESENIASWDKVLSSSFELMKQGKASIFVIYDRSEPIEISFNYNYDTILFSYISSYDIDYAKFSLGQVEIYKQLEWCINNGYQRFEMGWGDMGYKRQWSNGKYQFHHHILYPKYSIVGYLYANFKGNRSSILAFLISKGVNTHWNNLKKKLKKEPETVRLDSTYTFEKITIPLEETLEQIDLGQKNLAITKQIINDFLFLTQECSDDVSLYHSSSKDLYVLKGKKAQRAVLINPVNK